MRQKATVCWNHAQQLYQGLLIWLAWYVNVHDYIFFLVNICSLLFLTGADWETEWLLGLFSYVFNSIAKCSETVKPMRAQTKKASGRGWTQLGAEPDTLQMLGEQACSDLHFRIVFWEMLCQVKCFLITTLTSNTLSCLTMKIRLL